MQELARARRFRVNRFADQRLSCAFLAEGTLSEYVGTQAYSLCAQRGLSCNGHNARWAHSQDGYVPVNR